MSQQLSRINDVIYYIHRDISADLPAAKLAKVAAYSEQHFHRVFKTVVGESVHAYIRRVRLEFAANQLMFDLDSSVLTVAIKSGFSSVSSFSRAFKSVFKASPGQWRETGNSVHQRQQLAEQLPNNPLVSVDQWQWQLVEIEPVNVAYIRHLGYDKSIKLAWQTLLGWASSQGLNEAQQYGLLHSNPVWVPLADCRYVACIETDKPLYSRGLVNSLRIPGGLHAVFQLSGRYGDFLLQLSAILTDWLPSSGFKMQSTPAYVVYQKNHFLASDDIYQLELRLPVSFY